MIWRVENISFAVLGPRASGVISELPSPTTRTPEVFFGNSFLISSLTASILLSASSNSDENGGSSTVTYVPTGLPSFSAPASVVISISVTDALFTLRFFTVTPSFLPLFVISLRSIARSVPKII